jgi:O-antigen/teichoic acid export membrane protein
MLLLIGEDLETATSVILWLSPLIFLTGLSNIFGIQGMVSLGYNQAFKKILLISGVLNIGLAIPMSFLMGAQGTAISVLLTELVVTVAMGWFLYLRQPLFFKNIF